TLVGASGSYKSFIALDRALCIASGRPYLDVYKVRQGPVLYIAAEGGGGLKRRVEAGVKHHGVPAGPHPLYPGESALDFKQPDGRGEREELAAIIKEDMGGALEYGVVDTLERNLRGDENSTEDMGKFLDTASFLRDEFKATVEIIHHTGKDASRKERGSTALRGAVDSLYLVKKAANGQTCQV